MLKHNYVRSSFDCCVYFKQLSNNTYIYLLLYVDDMLLACKDMLQIDLLKEQLKKEFEMKDLGDAKKILGMEIIRDRGKEKLIISQKGYLSKVVQRFNMSDAKPTNVPLAAHFRLSSTQSPETEEEKEFMMKIPYANAIGSIMYTMV